MRPSRVPQPAGNGRMTLFYSIEILTGIPGVSTGHGRRRFRTVAVRLGRGAAEDRCRAASLESPVGLAYMYGSDGHVYAAYRQGLPLPEEEW